MPQPPRRSVARKNNAAKAIPAKEAKEKVLGHIAQGLKIADAMAAVGRSYDTYRDWYKNDAEFNAEVKRLRAARAGGADTPDGRLPIPDFPEFCEELGQPLFPHQLALWDVIEGREPRWNHSSFRYTRGVDWESGMEFVPGGRVIANIPPGHAKTTSISINYCTWLIYKNPNVKIVVVCKDQTLAKHIVGAVKFRLTSPVYRGMQAKYAPDGGFRDPDQPWTQTEIYVQGKDDGAKDPTMSALGIGGRIYGARSDVIILDDAVTLANVNEYEKQRRWLDQEVESRLDGTGLLAILGTRISPVDLYSHMREVIDWDEHPVYTYFSMPAIIDEGDGSPDTWQPLWPQQFPARRLRKIRRDESTWALVYQQQDVAEDATFNAKAVEASINRQRFPGPMAAGGMGHRPEGMQGLYVVGGLDPAAAGNTAMVICGLDKAANKRYILDGFNHRNTSANLLKDTVKRLTDTYKVNEWVVETNAFQRYLTQDQELVQYLRARGCKLTPHNTNVNKHDADFGVMTMAPLFLSCGEPPSNSGGGAWRKTPEKALIELPTPVQNAWVGELINQLVVWQPSGMKQLQKTDLVMALWFTHLACSRIMDRPQGRPTHMHNPFVSRERAKTRQVINIADYRAALEAEKEAV